MWFSICKLKLEFNTSIKLKGGNLLFWFAGKCRVINSTESSPHLCPLFQNNIIITGNIKRSLITYDLLYHKRSILIFYPRFNCKSKACICLQNSCLFTYTWSTRTFAIRDALKRSILGELMSQAGYPG